MPKLLLKRPKVSDLVIEEIKRMVRSGDLRQGDKLPNQNEFAAQLGVSRPSLREALAQLTRMGIIEQGPGVGTVLRTENPDLWIDHPTPPPLADERATDELLEARKSIESIMVEEAVENISRAELTSLARSVAKMKTAFAEGNSQLYLSEDVAFHYQIANGSHNRYIIYMFVTIRGLMEQFIRDMFEQFPELLENSMGHHQAILEAIEARDKDRAVAKIRDHIEDIHRSLQQYHQQNSLPKGSVPKKENS